MLFPHSQQDFFTNTVSSRQHMWLRGNEGENNPMCSFLCFPYLLNWRTCANRPQNGWSRSSVANGSVQRQANLNFRIISSTQIALLPFQKMPTLADVKLVEREVVLQLTLW